jgi:uncharacterized protein YheU (UPF0270 family)
MEGTRNGRSKRSKEQKIEAARDRRARIRRSLRWKDTEAE